MKYSTLYERLVANTRVEGECWIWTGRADPYPKMTMRKDGKHVTVKPHRLMLEITTGYEFPFDDAGHYRCFTPRCIHPEHLRIETFAENQSARRGYRECEGRLIPVLFPTFERLLQEAADAAWDVSGQISRQCPF